MMSPFQIPYYCALCGGEARASVHDARFLFLVDFFHRDPRVCQAVLAAKWNEEKKAA